ncbi:methylenetetrahydrofolate reductase (NADPH) [Aurantimicrobium minutum]|uniref:methylenetetrahydrofolate reductase n=1 Tax=Aurantimicrobium minutum TaxID=708131 RepID=UPI00247365BA|nr:methylenetetrahydrofolate reductase [Aurantimicrobium minutum]MDH6532766.1 methylenetetrahydrofolate reductase (NADPH) [Aurantimicrobium minutum]
MSNAPATSSSELNIGVPFSFEVYPPRNPELQEALHRTILELAASGPDFISVTYGAGGSSRDATLDCVKFILANTDVEPMAHLTCVAESYQGANELVRTFLDAGVRSYLALRGDPPEGTEEGENFLGDLGSASELVQLIHRVQAEREPFVFEDEPRWHVGATRLSQKREFVRIGVAAFPNGHPQSRSKTQDIDVLLAKQAAGANLAITQLFFHADDYLSFAHKAKEAGLTMPIIPGIMPVISPGRLRRMIEISGEEMPSDLEIALEIEPTAEGQREIGVDHAANLARELIAGGAPGVHLYAFNQSGPVLDVLGRLKN